ncbi:MAG: class IV adenylate cyclase [Candidatus Micrarchaeia archaeon]
MTASDNTEFFNIEIKAKCRNPNLARKVLRQRKAEFVGVDHQVDTYFNLPPSRDRLKLKEGDIKNSLIFYRRENKRGPKKSDVIFVEKPGHGIKELLAAAMGVKTVVDKRREIYLIKNIEFHLDQVKGLGEFVEIEASNRPRDNKNSNNNRRIHKSVLLKQVKEYMKLFKVKKKDLISGSYSDMIINQARHGRG